MEEKLVFVNPLFKNTDGTYEYDLFFSIDTSVVWGIDWEYNNPSICDDLTPEESTYSSVYRMKTKIPFKTLREISCYSVEYATYEIIALAWIDIDRMEDYPENGRCVLKFNDTIDKVKEKLSVYEISLKIC